MKTTTKNASKGGTKRKAKSGAELSKPDSLWKDLVEEFLPDFIMFYFGKKLFNAIDFTVPPEYLEQEFNEVFAANEPNKKIADKIIRVRLKNGKYKFIILHIEFQGKAEKQFRVRMFTYFVFIFIKYKTTDVTALAIYTGASRPAIYDKFHVEHYGTAVTYQFNAYTVREQNEAELLKSDNPFAFATLASLYLILAGNDDAKKLEYKKKLLEIAFEKGFDFAKLFRLLNFVKYLVKLPKPLEMDFQEFANNSKIDKKVEKMEATKQYSKEFIETFYPFFRKEIEKIKDAALTEALAAERKKVAEKAAKKADAERKKADAERKKADAERKKADAERKIIIINLYKLKTFDSEAIAHITSLPEKYIQTTIDDYKESLLKKA